MNGLDHSCTELAQIKRHRISLAVGIQCLSNNMEFLFLGFEGVLVLTISQRNYEIRFCPPENRGNDLSELCLISLGILS